LLRRLAELGVPTSLQPLPSLSLSDVRSQLVSEAVAPALEWGAGAEAAAARDVWWAGAAGVGRGAGGSQPWSAETVETKASAVDHQGAINPILLLALDRAQAATPSLLFPDDGAAADLLGAVLARVHPPFARALWHHMARGLLDASPPSEPPPEPPDVVVFANARDPSDELLARAAKLVSPGVKLVMDLPNLWPARLAALTLDALVAPSTFAAQHASVRAAVADAHAAAAEGGAERPGTRRVSVHVIPPGVNATSFDPASVGQLACSLPGDPATSSTSGFRCGKATPSVGFLGRLAPEKSPGLFLRAAALAAQSWPSLRVVVIGDGARSNPL
jgi:glycosyltransferase involved in cell wall biosynthesis